MTDMTDIKYIMVTSWTSHWDRLTNKNGSNSTYYSLPLIKDNIAETPFPDHATTLFIRLDDKGKFQKSWIGISKNFRKNPNTTGPSIKFDVADLKEISCSPVFNKYGIGWHLNKENVSSNGVIIGNDLQPGFFKKMDGCSWAVFEQHCFHLLRLIGIHDVHVWPIESQQGKADGFFRFQSLAVTYDASLNEEYEDKKAQQIDNYISQLQTEKFDFGNYVLTIKDTQKQVWIITRGKNVKLLKTVDHIKVKEIPYKKFIELYDRRMKNEIGTLELEEILKTL